MPDDEQEDRFAWASSDASA